MKSRIGLLGVAVAALFQVAVAYAYKTEVIVKAENKADFAAVVAAIHQQMAPGGRYEFVDKNERAQIDTNFGEMQSLFDKYGTVAQMDQAAKVQLFNDQEAINAILTQRDDKRLICRTMPPTGSLIPKTSCKTYREIQAEQMGTQNYMQRLQQVPQPVGGH